MGEIKLHMSLRLPHGEYVSNTICASRVNIMVSMFDALNSHLQFRVCAWGEYHGVNI